MANPDPPDTSAAVPAKESAAPGADAQSTVEPSWRQDNQKSRRFGPRLTRLLALAVPALFLVLLLLVMFQPFRHPRTHLFTLTDRQTNPTDGNNSLYVPLQPFVIEDLNAFDALAPALYQDESREGPVAITSVQQAGIHTLGEWLTLQNVGPKDNLLLYVRALGNTEGDQAVLVWSFEPERVPMGRFRLRDFLAQLAEFPAAEKIVFLDSGDLTHDPRLGTVVNVFPERLRAEVERTGDPHLWVLSSHQMFEKSHTSLAKTQTLFGLYLSRGLTGEADLNSDRAVDLDELYRFVSASVQTHVREKSDGNASQTPSLFWGGGKSLAGEWPVLLPVVESIAETEESSEPTKEGEKTPSAKESFQKAASLSPLKPVRPTLSSAVSRIAPATPTLPTIPPVVPVTMPTVPSAGTIAGQLEQAAATQIQQAGHSQTTPQPPPGQPVPSGTSQQAAVAPTASPKATTPAGASAVAPQVGAEAVKEPEPLPRTVPELFSKVWELRDRLADPESSVPRPLDYAPHLWRAFEEQLIASEQISLAGAIGDQAAIASALGSWIRSLERLAEDRTDLPTGAPALALRMVELLPQNPLPDERVFSLGMVELRGRLAREPLSSELQTTIQTFDKFTIEGTPVEFAAWLKSLPVSTQQYLEIRLAYRLQAFAEREWPLVQLALKTRRQAEQVPTLRLGAQLWIEDRMAVADRLRLEGERELIDQANRGWRERAAERLQAALSEYERAGEEIEVIHVARKMRNDLLHRLPSYVRWWHAAGDSSSPVSVAPGSVHLANLMKLLSRQSALLENPAAETIVEIARLHQQLELLQRQIESPLRPEFISGLVSGQAANGDVWRVRVLLTTPLPNRETRMQLLGKLWQIDELLESRLSPVHIPEKLSSAGPLLTSADWERLSRRSELDTHLAELAALDPVDDAGATKRVQTAFTALQEAHTTAAGNETPDGEELFPAYAELGEVLRDFYSTLPGRISAAYRHNEHLDNEDMRAECLCALRATDRSMRLLDPRDVLKMTDTDPIGLLRRAEAADLLAWQYRRLNDARYDAEPIEVQYLTATAQVYRNVLGSLPRTAPPLMQPSPLELDVEEDILLPAQGISEIAVDLHWKGLAAAEVWLVLKYDADLIEVTGNSEIPTYHEDRLRQLGLSYPFRPPADRMAPTAMLKPGESVRLRFRVQAKTESATPTKLIFKAVTREQYIREAMLVSLPFPELFQVHLGGIPASWSTTDDGWMLHPYPNQDTSFQLRLSSEESLPRMVDVELSALEQPFAFKLPRVALSPEAAADWLARLGPETSLASVMKLAVPANGVAVEIPFPASDEKTPAPMPMTAPMPNGNGAAPMEAAKPAASQPPTVPIPHGLLLTITDAATGRKMLKRIQLAPQRPRRYLRARVGYNLERERIEVRVEMEDPALFSPNGVRISGELAEGLQPGWTAQLADRLQSPNDVARLFVNIPEQQGRIVTLRLHADGYPRAFVFRVPCDADSDDLPEEKALHEVRIISPLVGSAFPVPTESVPAVFQVDAPHGTFETGGEIVQVGIDKDRDRTFLGDSPLRFATDRQVKHHWVKAGSGGWITLGSSVLDFQVDVPTWGLENAEVNLLANLVTPTKTSWSLPKRLVFDGVGPKLARPELHSGDATIGNVVTQGKDLAVSVHAGDFAKSGVVKVEAAFDLAGIGQFAPDAKPIPAKLGENDRWTAVLGTGELKPGTYVVLFQGTDRVGNKGDYVSTTVQVVSPEEAAERLAERTNVFTGVVLDGKNPAPKINVTLTPNLTEDELKKLEAEKKQPVVIPPVVTDEDGKFAFPKVRIGNYKLTIEGITRGLRRRQETTIAIPPPPTRIKPLEIRIDKPPAP